MVLPGTGSHSPVYQFFTCGWARSSGVSCSRGVDTISRKGAGKWGALSALTFSERALKISQSVFDSQQGGTAAPRGGKEGCRLVGFKSFFPFQVAEGSTTSEYRAEV